MLRLEHREQGLVDGAHAVGSEQAVFLVGREPLLGYDGGRPRIFVVGVRFGPLA